MFLGSADLFRDVIFLAFFLILGFLRCSTLKLEMHDIQAINMSFPIEYFFL